MLTQQWRCLNLTTSIFYILFLVEAIMSYGQIISSSPYVSGVRRKFSWGGFQSAKIFLCTKIESMIRKNIKKAAIQYVNVVKQL